MSRPPLVFRPSTDTPIPAEPGVPPAPSTVPTPPATGRGSRDARSFDADAEFSFSETGGIDAFAPEQEIRYKTHRPASTGPGFMMIAVAATIVVGILGLTFVTLNRSRAAGTGEQIASDAIAGTAATPAGQLGQAQFDSRPGGAEVLVDGVPRGRTPLKLSLPVGAHTLEIRSDAGSRTLPLNIEAGVLVSQYVELLAGQAVNAGRLDISSDPAGAQVALDGVVKGVTPLSLDAVEAREHTVSLTRGTSTVLRKVRVTPGATASVFAALGSAPSAPGATGGYLAFDLPFEVQVLENGRLVGTSSSDRLMVPTGRHQFELVNNELQFRTAMTVNIEPGKTASPAVPVPDGSLSVNALPWAEVSIDGRPVGQTPLANVAVPIGSHEVVWRHPQLGERRQRVTVTAQSPARVGVNLAQ